MFDFICALPGAMELDFKTCRIQPNGSGKFFEIQFEINDGVLEIAGQLEGRQGQPEETQLALSLKNATMGDPKAERMGEPYSTNATAKGHCLVKHGTRLGKKKKNLPS